MTLSSQESEDHVVRITSYYGEPSSRSDFESADLKAHFGRFAWYAPNTWNPTLNPVEEANVTLIDRFEKR